MAMYISLYRWTDQGIRNVKESPDRISAGKQAAQALGATVKGVYVTMGQYDLVVIYEAPDDVAAATFNLALGSQGNIHSETLRAFSEDEFHQLVAGLP